MKNRTKSLFKIDSKGKTREWFSEWGLDENDSHAWRVHSGLKGGKMVVSGWKVVKAKNVGRSNATTAEEQAEKAARAKWQRQKDSGYCEDLTNQISPPRPMLAKKFEGDAYSEDGLTMVKYDGQRCLIRADGMWSRTGKKLGGSVEHIWLAVKDFIAANPGIVLDGELYNHDYCDNFEGLMSLISKTKLTDEDKQSCKEKIQFFCYDCYFEGRPMNFYDRWALIPKQMGPLKRAPYREGNIRKAFEDALENQYEGVMVRIPNFPYENKRSKSLLKYKEFEDAEFEVVDLCEGLGNYAKMIKKIVVKLPNGKTCDAGIRGSQSYLKKLFKKVQNGWLPQQATVRYFGFTKEGKLRFPVCKKLWDNARDV